MIRLIDADALKDRLQEALEFQEKHDNYEGAELFEIAQDIVDEQSTIDAIPIKWLENRLNALFVEVMGCGALYSDRIGELVNSINKVMYLWQQERDGQCDTD